MNIAGHGSASLLHFIGVRRKKDDEAKANSDPAATHKPVLVGLRAVYVFDVSQTEGAELPQFTERIREDARPGDVLRAWSSRVPGASISERRKQLAVLVLLRSLHLLSADPRYFELQPLKELVAKTVESRFRSMTPRYTGRLSGRRHPNQAFGWSHNRYR